MHRARKASGVPVSKDNISDRFDILNGVDLAVFVLEIGADGLPRYVAINEQGRALTGFTRQDYIGKTARELFGGATGERAFAQQCQVAASGQEATYEITLPAVQRSAYLQTTLRPVFREDGTLTHLVGSSADVTSERERDTALQLAKSAVRKAEAAGTAKEQFLANMSHEIRTPMNGILGVSELLKETALDDQQALLANTISNSADALLDIINDILDFSKIQVQGVTLHNEPFSLRGLVQDTGTLLWARADFKGLELRTEYPDDIPVRFTGDKNKIRQIILNLLGNAIKFTDAGWVTLRADYDRADPVFPLRLSVIDTGPGIDPSEKSRIFAAFEQADRTPTRRAEGTGLGLAITQALVERMCGRVDVESRLGEGSAFTVRLNLPIASAVPSASRDAAGQPPSGTAAVIPSPSRASDTAPQGLAQADASGPLAGLKILVAEDNKTNQLLVQKILEPTGAELKFVSNGRDAVEYYKKTPSPIVLMDLSMPFLGGLDATRQIRAFEAENHLPPCRIIALTANARPSDYDACTEAGMNAFLTKPFRKAELMAQVCQPDGPASV